MELEAHLGKHRHLAVNGAERFNTGGAVAVTDKLAHRTERQQSQDTLVAVFGEHFAASLWKPLLSPQCGPDGIGSSTQVQLTEPSRGNSSCSTN